MRDVVTLPCMFVTVGRLHVYIDIIGRFLQRLDLVGLAVWEVDVVQVFLTTLQVLYRCDQVVTSFCGDSVLLLHVSES